MNTRPCWGAYARNFNLATLDYHAQSTLGKLAIVATKPMDAQCDLALAYSLGVTVAYRAIIGNPQ